MAPHLLVTNDFPPRTGGIQTYLWELWRRLPPSDVTVLAAAHPGAAAFDDAQPFRIERWDRGVLLPTPALRRAVDRLADEVGAGVVVLDPVAPLGLVGPHLSRPYVVVVHGSELVGRLPVSASAVGRCLAGAAHVVAAGRYAAGEASRLAGAGGPPVTVIPPGVDPARFRPLSATERRAARDDFGLGPEALVVLGLSRLVPRKGFDVLIDAVAELAPRYPALELVVGGSGRDAVRLGRRIRSAGAPARLLGRVPEGRLPSLYGAADLFAMCCRTRWWGLEPEGFGIVYLEAAAAGLAQLAGASGGSGEAVVDGVTGVVVERPGDRRAVAAALETLVADPGARRRMGERAEARARAEFGYDGLAGRLAGVLEGIR